MKYLRLFEDHSYVVYVFKNIDDAVRYSKGVYIEDEKVNGSVYLIEGDWEKDVCDPTKDISSLKNPKKISSKFRDN